MVNEVQTKKEKPTISLSVKSFIFSMAVILALWIGVYIASFFIPSGEFTRVISESGKEMIVSGTYQAAEADFPFWKFLLSPVLLFGSSDGTNIILIIIFLFIVVGAMNCLNSVGIMKYLVDKISAKFSKTKYVCLLVIMLFFMLMGSFVGSFEEVVPFIPVMVTLSISFGWDTFTGIAMSLIADACGFAAGVMNPFTVGIAEQICNSSIVEGVGFRIVAFVLIYALLAGFMLLYVKRIDKKNETKEIKEIKFEKDPNYEKAVITFIIIMGVAIAILISSSFIEFLRDYSIIFIALGFLLSGLICPLIVKTKFSKVLKDFGSGVVSMLPAVLMILFASSIKYILVETKSLDTILNFLMNTTEGLSPVVILLIIYLTVLIMNFFIPSGSAKAFLIMPLVFPLAVATNVPIQLAVMAFAFGDGFSNVFYPTNPVMLIGLNIVDLSYKDYFKKVSLYQLANLLLTAGILVVIFLTGLTA